MLSFKEYIKETKASWYSTSSAVLRALKSFDNKNFSHKKSFSSKQMSLPFKSATSSASRGSGYWESPPRSIGTSLVSKRIIKNPTSQQFDDLFSDYYEPWVRVLKYKGDWYVWEGGGTTHDDVMTIVGIKNHSYYYGEDQGKRSSVYAVQLEKVGKDELVISSDSIDGSYIVGIRRKLSSDRKFCEFTKNWKVIGVHEKKAERYAHNILTRSQTKKRILRDIKLNLAERID